MADVATPQQIIGKINPVLYAENGKELLKKYGSIENIPADEVKPKSIVQHLIRYDSPSEQLEPLYFWVVDLMSDFGLNPEKIVDNFASSPGGGHFGELGQRATIMQQQGSKILGDVNTVLRSVLNLVYDLKDFRTRLSTYDDLKSEDKGVAQGAKLSLKQIWLDKVDIQKGNSSVKAMALGQGGFQTLLDAFLVAENEKDVEKLDLNERVKRILWPRIQEFNVWVQQSEKELRKRYALEKNYLKSQVNSLKLYSRWAKPYLRAAAQLESKNFGDKETALVKVFNTLLLELSVFGKSKIDPEKAAIEGTLPTDFTRIKTKRDYYGCVLVDFRFRGIPQRLGGQQGNYVFGGRTEITFSAYSLNEDEIEKFQKELGKSDIEDVLGLIEGITGDSMKELQKDIDDFLNEKDAEEEKKKKSSEVNPIFALLGFYEEKKEKTEEKTEGKKEEKKQIRPDDWIEKTHLRPFAGLDAMDKAFDLFDIYKKAHQMPSWDPRPDFEPPSLG